MFVPFDDPLIGEDATERNKKRAMQLILDEIHGMQRDWEREGGEEWAAASTINSSKVLIVTVSYLSLVRRLKLIDQGTDFAVHAVIERCQDLNLANPVMDVQMP
jgi:hypothetical protein